jgi:hypothetical protein
MKKSKLELQTSSNPQVLEEETADFLATHHNLSRRQRNLAKKLQHDLREFCAGRFKTDQNHQSYDNPSLKYGVGGGHSGGYGS